jgi:polyisoprenoid-binding protein YceI
MRRLWWLAGFGWLAGVSTAADFALDTSHTAVHFGVLHYDLSMVRGRVAKVAGTVRFDPVAKTGAIDIRVDADSLDTGNRTLDQILRSDQYLDTARYGDVRYAGDGFVFDGERLVAIDGTLVLHGVARPVRLTAQRFTCKEVRLGLVGHRVCGGEFTATILRSDFGMTRFLPEVGDAVLLTIGVEATPQ